MKKDKEINHFVVSILFSVPLSDCVFPACKGSRFTCPGCTGQSECQLETHFRSGSRF